MSAKKKIMDENITKKKETYLCNRCRKIICTIETENGIANLTTEEAKEIGFILVDINNKHFYSTLCDKCKQEIVNFLENDLLKVGFKQYD